MDWASLMQFLVAGITTGSIYALVALGLTVVVNTSDVINVAHGEFVMLGGMITIALVEARIPLLPAVLLALLLVVAISLACGALAIIPLIQRGATSMMLIMLTIGISTILAQAAGLIWGKHPLYLESFSGNTPIRFLGAFILPQTFWVLGVTLLIMPSLYLFFNRTKLGLAMLACSINRTAAALLGVNVRRVTLYALALGGFLGALGGVLVTPISATSYTLGVGMLLKGFTAATLGGLGNATGAVIGGLVLGTLESLASGYVSSGYKDFIALTALLVVLIVRPKGILGTRLM